MRTNISVILAFVLHIDLISLKTREIDTANDLYEQKFSVKKKLYSP